MGLLKKAFNYATFKENPLHKVDDAIQSIGGYGNLALAAGIAIAGVATGGAAAAAGYGALASYGAAAAGIATGAAKIASGYQGVKDDKRLEDKANQQQMEIDKENAKADAQRRANLLSLRKQVGAVNVGAKSTVFSGGGETDKKTATGVVLG